MHTGLGDVVLGKHISVDTHFIEAGNGDADAGGQQIGQIIGVGGDLPGGVAVGGLTNRGHFRTADDLAAGADQVDDPVVGGLGDVLNIGKFGADGLADHIFAGLFALHIVIDLGDEVGVFIADVVLGQAFHVGFNAVLGTGGLIRLHVLPQVIQALAGQKQECDGVQAQENGKNQGAGMLSFQFSHCHCLPSSAPRRRWGWDECRRQRRSC